MIATDHTVLRLPQRTAGQKRDLELYPGDIAKLKQLFPHWEIWKKANQDVAIIDVSDKQRLAMLNDASNYLQSKKWDREPYQRENSSGGQRITWSQLLTTVLIPALE